MTQTPPLTASTSKSFPVRRMDFDFGKKEESSKYFFSNNRQISFLLLSHSAGFPSGERMFIRAVKNYLDRIKDPALIKAVRDFIGQEANHSKEHRTFNEFMNGYGLPVKEVAEDLTAYFDKMISKSSESYLLALTCAAEHFTAMMAERVLEEPRQINDISNEAFRACILWHVIEEAEHKAVAFDVYQNQVGSYWKRIGAMLMFTFIFNKLTISNLFRFLKADGGGYGSFNEWREFWRLSFGENGVFKGMLPHYLSYFSPKFHPNNNDISKLIEEGRGKLRTYVGDKVDGIQNKD